MNQRFYMVRVQPTYAMEPTGCPAEGYWTKSYAYRRNALNCAVKEARRWAYTGPRGEQESLAIITVVEV